MGLPTTWQLASPRGKVPGQREGEEEEEGEGGGGRKKQKQLVFGKQIVKVTSRGFCCILALVVVSRFGPHSRGEVHARL